MKALILAAGAGSRLNEITGGLPKPLVDINGTPLIQRQIDLLKKKNIQKIIVIRGFKSNEFQLDGVTYVDDIKYQEHDQLGSLITAESELNEDLLITFGDIVFDENIIEQILSSKVNFGVAIDLNWTESYKKRTDNPIELAGKVLIKDDTQMLIGSANLTELGTEVNFELGVLIEGPLVKQMLRLLSEMKDAKYFEEVE